MSKKILLVEDEPGLVMTLSDLLEAEGYQVETAAEGHKALSLAAKTQFQLILLDVMLPDKSGFDICRDLRQRGDQTPILMLTARGQVVDKVLGLKLGADDYMTKPFEPLELLARIEALLRRAAVTSLPDSYHFGPIHINFTSTEVWRDGKLVELSAREFELLQYFIERNGETIPRSQLLRDVWGYNDEALTRTVDVHVSMLRQKLEDDAKNPRYFLTVRGFGYKFVS